ncbi:HNH endonuclease signature motif containing protein [[Clostridium] fimetarium]|uniref:HNH endonuclease n=1 Tax=[Clostridium] fimetarium TaxID=99656 RepID=A0A1I0NEN3_9FIRM|nr:HNH endonuclease domain-containing protein [[Clostridium] fimetarium]SEV99736.1 HNH endonuclease [[Clostridium] fimetarium]
MAGFELKEGKYVNRLASDDDLWAALSSVFSSCSKNDSSYKYGFLKSIIDNIYNVDEELILSFDQLFSKFAEIYWNLILKYEIKQKSITNDNRQTHLEQILHETARKYKIYEGVPFESLPKKIIAEVSHKVKMKCKTYVVGALYEDTKQLFYSFSKKDEWIQINPLMYEFICKHKSIIEKLNYYEWAKFLEKVNNDSVMSHLLDKLDESAKRNNLSAYRQILFEEFEERVCFYCGRKLSIGKIEVDHFIPWSFIKDDNLWNLVLSCSECNRQKSDKLPDKIYLNTLAERNNVIMIESNYGGMKNYRNDKLKYIYYWAKMNGYNKIWKPTNVVSHE